MFRTLEKLGSANSSVRLWCGGLVFVLAGALVGCTAESIEEAKQEATEAAEAASDAAQEAGQAAGEAVDSAAAAASEAASAAADAATELKEQLKQELSDAAEQAASALEGFEGGGEVLTKLREFFASAKESLHGVADGATAESASAKFEELTSSFQGLTEQAALLPDEAKTAIKGFVQKGLEQLRQLVEKVLATPEIKEKIGPQLEALIAKVQGMTAE